MRAVNGDPDYKPATTPEEIQEPANEFGCLPQEDPAHAGWDLSMGARINYGRDPNGQLCVDLHLGPDYDGSGIVRRAVTPNQLVQHAMHLLQVVRGEILLDGTRPVAMAMARHDIDEAIEYIQIAKRLLNRQH